MARNGPDTGGNMMTLGFIIRGRVVTGLLLSSNAWNRHIRNTPRTGNFSTADGQARRSEGQRWQRSVQFSLDIHMYEEGREWAPASVREIASNPQAINSEPIDHCKALCLLCDLLRRQADNLVRIGQGDLSGSKPH